MATIEHLDDNVVHLISSYASISDYPSLRVALHNSNIDRSILNPSMHDIPHDRAHEYLLARKISPRGIWKVMSVIIDRKIFVPFSESRSEYGLKDLRKEMFVQIKETIISEIEGDQLSWFTKNMHDSAIYQHVSDDVIAQTPLRYITRYSKKPRVLMDMFDGLYTREEIMAQVIRDYRSSRFSGLDEFDVIDVDVKYPLLFIELIRAARRGVSMTSCENIEASLINYFHNSATSVDDINDMLDRSCRDGYEFHYLLTRMVAAKNRLDLGDVNDGHLYCLATPELISHVTRIIVDRYSRVEPPYDDEEEEEEEDMPAINRGRGRGR
jgi:hypothetical protein